MKAYFATQGDLHKVAFVQSANCVTASGGGERGKIVGFSPASRRRLLHLFARLNPSRTRSVFLTLTFAAIPTTEDATRAFRRLKERIRRKFPRASFIWRKEPQERGSWHYHLILFNFPYVPQATLQKWWQECTREPLSIVHVKLLRGKRQAFYYVSKYCAKLAGENPTSFILNAYLHAERTHEEMEEFRAELDQLQDDGETESLGRMWGIFQKWKLPYAEFVAFEIKDFDTALYMRWRGLQTAKVTYFPSKYSNIQYIEFGGGGQFGFAVGVMDKLSDLPAVRLQQKFKWY